MIHLANTNNNKIREIVPILKETNSAETTERNSNLDEFGDVCCVSCNIFSRLYEMTFCDGIFSLG